MWLAVPATAVAATTEEVLAKLVKSEAGVTTFEADTKMISKAGEKATEMTGHMAWQVVMKDGKRAGMLVNVKQQMTTEETGTFNMLVVDDGEFVWTETRNPQVGIMVIKNRPDAAKQQTGDTQQLRDKYDLKLIGEEEFDGQQMWVLEGTPKNKAEDAAAPRPRSGKGMAAQAGEPAKVHVYIGQKDLMCHRFRAFDKAGNEMLDMQFTNLKVNGSLDPALFKYAPPKGARVMDMTKGMPDIRGMMKGMPKEQAPVEAPPAE
jgi:outer membrane lipoprotein-sorting protein